ncbi:MAG TPA: HEAT repeat domain-containing protein [Candidatus Sulfotelmatobacter sp.]|nr:HEAT repeat domain-containing protein [Candidatus Sulfotelmatobacter sp.]
MGVAPLFQPEKDPQVNGGLDPRLQPTPDYGTLGSGSDVVDFGSQPSQSATRTTPPRTIQLLAVAIGMVAAIVAGRISKSHREVGASRASYKASTPVRAGQLAEMKEQKQAESLLEQAVGHTPGAVEQISSHVNEWHGKVRWNSQIANLATAALNSDDMRVRESGVEVELAAYGLSKNSQSLEYLLKIADSPDHAQKIWALWALGLMANRGVETEQVVPVLTSHLADADIDSRRWAVEALALSGSDSAMESLLKTMHDDASPIVRERAACGVASSGLFTPEQRAAATPRLIEYSDDPSLDAQTHAWAFHALSDITHQRLPNDASAWRQWYASRSE